MDPRLITSITLENQLTMELLDASRRIAADRWQVEFIMQIKVPVAGKWFSGHHAAPAPQEILISALGETTLYKYRDVRNFVDDQEKEALLDKMQDDLLVIAPRYYGHPDFAARFIIKQYAAHQKKRMMG